MQVRVGEWWATTHHGAPGTAHRVAAVLPDLTRFARDSDAGDDARPNMSAMLLAGYDRWVALCRVGLDRPAADRQETAVVHSAFAGWPDALRCSECEVRSPAFDAWLAEQAR